MIQQNRDRRSDIGSNSHDFQGNSYVGSFGVDCFYVCFLFVFQGKGCAKGREETKPATQQAAEAIRDLGKKPIDKARAAQNLGDDRTKAIDEAVESQDRQ